MQIITKIIKDPCNEQLFELLQSQVEQTELDENEKEENINEKLAKLDEENKNKTKTTKKQQKNKQSHS